MYIICNVYKIILNFLYVFCDKYFLWIWNVRVEFVEEYLVISIYVFWMYRICFYKYIMYWYCIYDLKEEWRNYYLKKKEKNNLK